LHKKLALRKTQNKFEQCIFSPKTVESLFFYGESDDHIDRHVECALATSNIYWPNCKSVKRYLFLLFSSDNEILKIFQKQVSRKNEKIIK
jgi:hypothetical protein